jgi:MFS family permease
MLPDSWLITIPYLIFVAILGMVIGGVSGWLTSLFTKARPRRVRREAILGAGAFFAGFFIAVYLPWHTNTISYRLSNDVRVTSTANFYQHPDWVGIVCSILVPVLYELIRAWRKRPSVA